MSDLHVTIPEAVMEMILDCKGSHLYGDTLSDVVLSLLRPALLDAVKMGVTKL